MTIAFQKQYLLSYYLVERRTYTQGGENFCAVAWKPVDVRQIPQILQGRGGEERKLDSLSGYKVRRRMCIGHLTQDF